MKSNFEHFDISWDDQRKGQTVRYRSFLPSLGQDSLTDGGEADWEEYHSIQHLTSMENTQSILR